MVGQAEILSCDLKKIGDDGFLPTAKLWHNVLLAKFAGAMFAENVAFGSRRCETLCIELDQSLTRPRTHLTDAMSELKSESPAPEGECEAFRTASLGEGGGLAVRLMSGQRIERR